MQAKAGGGGRLYGLWEKLDIFCTLKSGKKSFCGAHTMK
jgi:hypothetical protein